MLLELLLASLSLLLSACSEEEDDDDCAVSSDDDEEEDRDLFLVFLLFLVLFFPESESMHWKSPLRTVSDSSVTASLSHTRNCMRSCKSEPLGGAQAN